jgi:hypothetical protein
MVRTQAYEHFQTFDRIISVRDRIGRSLDSLSGSAKPGTERRPVRASMVLRMVHQMGHGRRVEERGEPYQRDDETEGDQAAREAA